MSADFRLRLCYAKAGRGSYLSHLEVLRALTRAIRRSGLPFAVTCGFNPHMRIALGPALGVGVGSDAEYLDVSLTEYVPANVALARLQAVQTAVLPFLRAGYVNGKDASLNAVLDLQRFRVRLLTIGITPLAGPRLGADGADRPDTDGDGTHSPILPAGFDIDVVGDARTDEGWHVAREGKASTRELSAECLAAGFAAVRSQEALSVSHKGKTKVFDPRLCIPNDVQVSRLEDTLEATFDLRISPQGSLRPDVLIQAVFAQLQLETPPYRLTRVGLFMTEQDGVRPPL
ncbi:MAG: TIGR03936 family radical SAM-associated protein [Actinomycetes bacterium]|jgi:hypothetical protein|nr:TIGR03936 family radical SAM-associated protein [Actinomycetes bacterium]